VSADATSETPPGIDSYGGLLGTTVRWATFLFLTGTLVASLAVLAALRGHRLGAIAIGYVAASALAVSVLYYVATNGTNPGAVLKGQRAAWLQPMFVPYRSVAWCICVGARVARRGLLAVNEVAPGVYLGMRLFPRETSRLEAHGIRCVVDLAAELPDNARIVDGEYERLRVPVLDRCAPTLDEVTKVADWTAARVREGKRVYLHCAFGRGRSAMAAAAVLLRLGEARTPDEAVMRVKRARPLIGVKGVQYQRLHEYARTRLRSD
jgi:hypothetical protein